MERIYQHHPKQIPYLFLSRVLERSAHVGFRVLLVIFLVEGFMQMDRVQAYSLYAWVIGIFVYSQVVGALAGDLLIGNKKAIILGAFLQSLGIILLCITTSITFYAGLLFIILGGSLYTPNLMAFFGKRYINKDKLLDAGFTIYYLATNLGGLLGSLVIAYIGKVYGWNAGFILASLLMLLSAVPLIKGRFDVIPKQEQYQKTNSKNRVITVIIALFVIGIFWTIYKFGNIGMRNIHLKMEMRGFVSNTLKTFWNYINYIFVIPLSLVAIAAWTKFYTEQFYKLIIGFLIGAIAFSLLSFAPQNPTEQSIQILVLFLFLLSISEIFIVPVVLSLITKNVNSKYLATFMSLIFIPESLIFALVFSLHLKDLLNSTVFMSKIALASMLVISIGLYIYYEFFYKSGKEDSEV